MKPSKVNTQWAKVYIAGPINIIEQVCRKYVMIGLCVTVTPTNYIYSGGEESGVEIGLINYPRFPSTQENITQHAVELGNQIMEECHQLSYTVMTPDETLFYSRKEELGIR